MAVKENEECACDESKKPKTVHSEKKELKSKAQKKEKCECEGSCDCEKYGENYLELAQRIQADFDNYRKRSAEIVRTSKQDGIIEAVTKILPSLDAVQKAKTMIKDKSVLEGVNLIEKGLKHSLTTLDIEEIDAKGQQFDPRYHNVVAVKYDNLLEDGKIIEVYQAGYKIKERIIRYAQVVVNKK